jgi:signal transduction histidine kinase
VLLLEDKWSKKDIELQLDFDEYFVEANEELLKEVWINLIDNAIKYSPNGGAISVDIRSEKEALMVSVKNNGPEIPPDKIDRIWNRFYQADESHSSVGNGIGLAIVKRIVELHSGTASVKSSDGTTEFVINLPKRK